MKCLMITATALLIIMLGGCGMNSKEAEEKPDQYEESKDAAQNETSQIPYTKAFQDEYTREFLDPSAKTEKGFHLLKSKTGGYEMLFPENAVISEFGNELDKDQFESFIFDEQPGAFGFTSSYDLTYISYSRGEGINSNLESLANRVGYIGEYTNKKIHNMDIYYANEVFKEKNNDYYTYFGMIKKPNETNNLQLIYSVTCKKNDKTCLKNNYEDYFLKILSSVKFIEE